MYLLLIGLAAAFTATLPSAVRFEWNTNAVRVVGPVLELNRADWSQALSVVVEPVNVLNAIGLPAIVGTYSTGSNFVQFAPRFPFEPGLTYRATFNPARTSSVFRLPDAQPPRSTVVTQVFPSADVLPQNLLKFYVHFSASMSGGHIYEHIRLLEDGGAAVELPFLEIDEELWNRDMTRLTLFLDPGRIKRGVRPLEETGPALLPGKKYTLEIAADWLDARGAPLKQPFRKRFSVSEPDRDPPDPATWQVTPPHAGTREPLQINFPEPMDQALALRMIAIRGVNGEARTEQNEKQWVFLPWTPWKPGRYTASVLTIIEDLAGNNVGKPFEVDLEEGKKREPPRTISLSFEIP